MIINEIETGVYEFSNRGTNYTVIRGNGGNMNEWSIWTSRQILKTTSVKVLTFDEMLKGSNKTLKEFANFISVVVNAEVV